jgi:membrane protein DedA with SNARE-associated domain
MSFAYWVGKQYGDTAVKRFVGKQAMKEVTHLLSHLQDKKTFVLSRIILMPLEDLINFASGMAKLNYWWFISVSMIVVTAVSTVVIFL